MLRSDVRGGWLGLGLSTDRTTLLQAAVEGVAFAIRHALEVLPGPRPNQMRLVGGGALHPRFRMVLADVLRVQLRLIEVRSASAIGAALLAARAAGIKPADVPLQLGGVVRPSDRSAAYDQAFNRYRQRAELLAAEASAESASR